MTIIINITKQKLFFKKNNNVIVEYPISSALKGLGEKNGSEQTPRGKHIICEKIGDKMPIFTVFRARKPTGEIFNENILASYTEKDFILSRILWLSGTELGINCGGDVDTKSRYIYIHGTNDEKNIGTPKSHGCIRMLNKDVIALFDRVNVGEEVIITP
ncbi:MAG TPA: L,D-transpeptidase [Coxiellaceae bacterium]|nr:MAG: peptidase [Gammaproteobacteria bacterium RIFCSPHIGHO2_12_FULL_36_30]HLB56423.1 L,D-transpeptidase [Coxiellaceae bacterium]